MYVQRLFIVLFCTAIFGGAVYAWFSRPVIDRPTGGETVIAFGDSLTTGVGATRGNDYVSVLERRLGITIGNAGRSGNTTAAARERFAEDVLRFDPKVVILFLGGNDILLGTPTDAVMADLGLMIDALHGRGAAVLLVGLRGRGLFSDTYLDGYAALAEEKHVSFVPNILDGIFGVPEHMADEIHPNDRGYAVIAGRIEPVLKEMLAP